MRVRFEGVEKTVSNLKLCATRLKRTKETTQKEAGLFGLEVVQKKVPFESGEVSQNIVNLDMPEQTEIISMPSLGKDDVDEKEMWVEKPDGRRFKITDPGKPNLNVLLEIGDIDALNWKPFGVSQPKGDRQFHFMENSVPQTREEFIRLLNVGIQEATK
jgi:hypothetical protein